MLGVERPTDALMRVSDETVRPILPTVLVHCVCYLCACATRLAIEMETKLAEYLKVHG